PDSRLGETIRFFAFDMTKILLLLTGIVFVVTVLRSFLSIERTRQLLGGRREGLANVAAAALGVATPFCSCSAVPAFIGFVSAGVPLGVTLSFLIASPLVNEVALVLLYGMFGWRIALLYAAAGLLIAVAAGFVLGRLQLERWVEPFVFETRVGATESRSAGTRSRRPSGRSCPISRSASGSGPSSTDGFPRASSPGTPDRTIRSRSRSRCCSACRCIRTPPASSRSWKRCTPRDSARARCWRS